MRLTLALWKWRRFAWISRRTAPWAFALPFAREDEVRRHLVERLEEKRERLRRRLLQRQDAHVIVVEAQVGAMTLERGVAAVVVEERVLTQAHAVGLVRRRSSGGAGRT